MSIIFADSRGTSYRTTMTYRLFVGLLCAVVVLGLLLLVSVVGNAILLRYYANTSAAYQEQLEQTNAIQQLQKDIQSLKPVIQDLIQKEAEIREDLGTPKRRRLSKRRAIQKKISRFTRQYPSQNHDQFITHQIADEVHYLRRNVLQMEKNMRQHAHVFRQYQQWFEQTPSIWPVYGHIRSGYGWRLHPLKRTRQFHKGIDVPAWTGAPVQATADGYVKFSGWGGGYGWMIVLSHAFGYETIYAHLSELDVIAGNKVFKGQIIGKIGTSGLSTGPHVHYEIRHRRKAVEPSQYLSLNLFTAVSTLW